MGEHTKIQYADSTVNPVPFCAGCELYSEDSAKNHCYAADLVRRYAGCKGWPAKFTEPAYFPDRLVRAMEWGDLIWTRRPDKPWLNDAPRVVFINDLGDGFSPLADPNIWLKPWLPNLQRSPHVYLLLTKWPGRMVDFWLEQGHVPQNFHLGTTVTSRKAEWRIRELLKLWELRGVNLWLSLEPLLEVVDPIKVMSEYYNAGPSTVRDVQASRNNWLWIAAGDESGRNARYRSPDAMRVVRDGCQEADVPFFLKQIVVNGKLVKMPELDGRTWSEVPF